MATYNAEFRSSHSHVEGLRAAMDVFKGRAPFNVLSERDLNRAIEVLSQIPDARSVAEIIRNIDRRRDASLLADQGFLNQFEAELRKIPTNDDELDANVVVTDRQRSSRDNRDSQIHGDPHLVPKIEQLRAALENDPDLQQFLAALEEIGNILHRYITVHNRFFKFSPRRLLLSDGTDNPPPFQQEIVSLRIIESDLQRVMANVGQSEVIRDSESGKLFFTYGTALRAAAAKLRVICARLSRKADSAVEYTRSQYQRDLAEYKQRVTRYRALGKQVNALYDR